MVGPLTPLTSAQDHVTKVLPDLPKLGQARPTDTCLQLGDVEVSALAAVTTIQNEGTGYFAYDRGVPAICAINGQPLQQWKDLVTYANSVLDAYRTQAAFIQNQADGRLEYTYPDGPCQSGDNLTRQPADGGLGSPGSSNASRADSGLTCAATRPQFTILDDKFDGRRVGGFGSWSAVTEHGEAPGFRTVTRQTFNGTDTSYRFGDDSGYTRGAHEFLVSPELDLTAVRGVYYLVNKLTGAYTTAQDTLGGICHPGASPVAAALGQVTGIACRFGGDELIQAYQHAIDAYTKDLPLSQEAAGLDMTFRLNFAPNYDGIRPWVFVGDHPPTRAELFDRASFGRGATEPGCQPFALDSYDGGNDAIHNQQCFPRPGAGYHLLTQDPAQKGLLAAVRPIKAFDDPDRVYLTSPGDPGASDLGFTGDQLKPITVHLDLTSYVGERIWLIFEVATLPDTGRGLDPFRDVSIFPRQDAYGFDLLHVNSQGDAWPRNLRLKDVAQTYQRVPARDPWLDDKATRTTTPPGRDPIVVRVQNAGEYIENATVKLVIQEQTFLGGKSVGSFHDFGTVNDIKLVNVKPSEVRELYVPWPKALVEGDLYSINASIVLAQSSTVPTVALANVTNLTDPNATAVRPQNSAELGLGGATSALGLVRAFTNHHLTAVHAPVFKSGPVLEVCKSVTITGCVAQYTANKGERRILHTAVRNDGSAPEDINAVLTFTLDGIERSSALIDPPARVLRDVQPGETRAVDWAFAPADAGVYNAIVTFMPQNAVAGGTSVSRLIYVQRSTGIICFDNVGDDRACAPSFQRSVPDELGNADLTSVAAAADGTLYATSVITNTTGALFSRAPGGSWLMLENLSSDALATRFGATPRADLGFGNVVTITLAPDGTLYLAGENGTALARNVTGVLSPVAWVQEAASDFAAYVGSEPGGAGYSGQAGSDIPLAGGASGGSGSYTFRWSLVGAPAGVPLDVPAAARFANPTSAHTTFNPVERKQGTYIVNLNVTDSEGRTTDRNATVTVTMRQDACALRGGLVLAMDATVPVSSHGSAATVRCLRASSSPFPGLGPLGVGTEGTVDFFLDLAGPSLNAGEQVDYVIKFGAHSDIKVHYTPQDGPSVETADHRRTLRGIPPRDPTATMDDPYTNTIHVSVSRTDLGENHDGDLGAESVSLQVSVGADTIPMNVGGPGKYVVDGKSITSPNPVVGVQTRTIPRTGHGVHVSWPASSDIGASGKYVIERANDVTKNAWTVLGNTQQTYWDDTDLATYHEYGYRVTAINSAGNPSLQTSAPKVGVPLAPHPSFLSSAWWNGTLWLGSTDGSLWTFNATSKQLENQTLTLPETGAKYIGDLHALLATDDGLYAAGESGKIFLNEGKSWRLVRSPADPRTILALTQHAGAIFASGTGGLVENSSSKDEFFSVRSPDCTACDFAFIFETPTKELFLATQDGTFVTCAACLMKDPVWSYPEVPVPSFLRGSQTLRSQLMGVASNDRTTAIVTTGGAILEYAKRSVYDNQGDWSIRSPLIAHDGGVIETRGLRSNDAGGIYRWKPDPLTTNARNDPSSDWTELRVTLHHAIYIPPTAPAGSKAEVRVYYEPYPQAQSNSVGPTCQTGGTAPSRTGSQVVGTCANPVILKRYAFTVSSASDGMDETVLYFSGPTVNTTDGGEAPVPARFDSIEFYADGGNPGKAVNWVIDDFQVDTRSPTRDWTTAVFWKGPASKLGTRAYTCAVDAPTVGGICRGSLDFNSEWVESGPQNIKPFDFDATGAWHVTAALSDRPVWVLNNEEQISTNPRLQDNWNTRLITPILDLGEAYDPVITFRQAYAFRVKVTPAPDKFTLPVIEPVDGGWVEVQYERRGAECGADKDVTATCWSPFKKVFPDRGGVAEYPRPIDFGLAGATTLIKPTNQSDVYGNTVALNTSAMSDADYVPARAVSSSYWGRSTLMIPDETGTITGGRDTSTYETASIRLLDPRNRVYDQFGNNVSLAGRHIRVAFHAYTAHTTSDYVAPNATSAVVNEISTPGAVQSSFPREGWYITDLKVKGAQRLGIDLGAANMSFRVGYDVSRIGVGPGTRVPVNVTVENRGVFDVAGYTAQLEIRRVTDIVNHRTERVGLLTLGQQPLLPAGKSMNHTFYWDVPAQEGAQYVLTFVVTPLGIDHDEDPTDNVASLGSISSTVLAKTQREYHVEFFVSPENATTDITRYVPIFINNTGNVPLSDFIVTRVISLQGAAAANAVPETREWTTQRPVPPGTRVNLQGISDAFDPAKDLFWKASQRSDYKFFVGATTVGLAPSSQEKLIRSFATYFFDDVDVGPRGEATRGDWKFDVDWTTQTPGFRSQNAYGFGDNVLIRYPDNVDSSAVTPIIDLSGARSARFGFYTRFLFPDSFDAGVVEATADGGKTWHRLTPRDRVDENGTHTPGYGATIAATSPLHLTHDPTQVTRAFSGDSRTLSGNTDGWVYREFDLTDFTNVSESNLPYVKFGPAELANYRGTGQKDPIGDPTHHGATLAQPPAPNSYFDSTWSTGALDKYQYWEAQNLTESTVTSPVGHRTFWWSGSASLTDDETRPTHNTWLNISMTPVWYVVERNADGSIRKDADGYPIPLDALGRRVYAYNLTTGKLTSRDAAGNAAPIVENGEPRVPARRFEAEDRVVADWWEWMDRYGLSLSPNSGQLVASPIEGERDSRELADAWHYQGGGPASNLRVNVTKPVIIGQQGKWLHMQSDITSYKPGSLQYNVTDLAFVYAPFQEDATGADGSSLSGGHFKFDDARLLDGLADDRGFAVDGFNINAYKLVNGAPANARVLLSTADAWNASKVEQCVSADPDAKLYSDTKNPPGSDMPCWTHKSPGGRMLQRGPTPTNRPLVTATGDSFTTRTGTSITASALQDDGVDFVKSGVSVGDLVNVTGLSGKGLQAPVTLVEEHTLTLGDAYWPAQTALGGKPVYQVLPYEGSVGNSWAIVSALPGLPSTWNVTDVRTPGGPSGNYSHAPGSALPTGEVPKAWYTGSICPPDARIAATFTAASGSNRTTLVDTANNPLTLGVKAGDLVMFTGGPGKGNVTYVRAVLNETAMTVDRVAFNPAGATFVIISIQRTCLRAGSEERLVTPAIDLSRVAGDDATLTFWHQYAFSLKTLANAQHPFASGGVVEVQSFDPQTGWGAWQQIYACPTSLGMRDYFDANGRLQSMLDPSNETRPIDGETACATYGGNATRGGYSAFTVNATRNTAGQVPRLDPPFDAVHHVKRDGRTDDVQLLYSGNSAAITRNPFNAWVPARYDLTQFLGKQVRVGFHVAITGESRINQVLSQKASDLNDIVDPVAPYPEVATQGKEQLHAHGTGWWITNISVVGKVLEGAPIQLRMRAATDGNVHDGMWQIDDAGLFGSRYGRNVAIFVDRTPGAFGAFANNSSIVPVTLRNLGDTVRRDLAIEVRQIAGDMKLGLAGSDGQTWKLDTTDPRQPILRVSGFNLAPGQSVTIPLVIGIPNALASDTMTSTLHIVLKEYSAPDDKYVDVPDNEVVGFLQRDVDVTGERGAQPVFGTLATTRATIAVGDTVNVTVDITNPGHGPITLDLRCSATLVGTWQAVDHRKVSSDQLATSTDYPCTRAAGKATLAPQETSTYTFQARPTAAGIVKFTVNGTVRVGADSSNVTAQGLSVAVGRSTVIYHDGFTPAPKPSTAGVNDVPPDGDVKFNWTHSGKPDAPGQGGGEPVFDWPRGHDEPGAMLLGVTDTVFDSGTSYTSVCNGGSGGGGSCTATSPIIDLHNYTTEHLALSFWYLSKFANGDGGRVTASVLVDETKAQQSGVGSWITPDCPIQPVGGYTGSLTEFSQVPPGGGAAATDFNGYPGANTGQSGKYTIGPGPEGFFSGNSDAWQYAVFDLYGQGCAQADGSTVPLLGHFVRLNFEVFAGPANSGNLVPPRGPGQGWFIDDITLSPQTIDVQPRTQSATLLDNTTKAFNVILTNDGSAPDVVRLRLDEGNSSVPRGSIGVPADVALAPGETRIVPVMVTLPRDPSLLPTQFRARIIAQSIIDPAARGISDLVLEFAPRPWAELSVRADPPGGIVQEGTETFIPITVENDGVVDSIASSVVIVDHYVTSDGVTHNDLTTLDLPSMPSYFQKAEDASRVLEFRWRPARGSVGPHSLTITADPLQLGEEYTRLNNVVVLNVNVSELLIPDLDVTTVGAFKVRDASGAPVTAQRDADVTRYEVTAGELATLEIKLVNRGKAGATNVDLRAFIGTLSLPPKSIPYVPPGAELLVTFNWLSQKGEYPIEIIARTEQVEGSTTNNRNPAKGVTILIVKGYEVKTTITDVPTDLVAPTDVKVPFNVTNSGNAGEDLILQASVPEGWTVTLPRTSLFLRAGETYGAIATVHVPEAAVAGQQFITVQAIARENPMKVAGASSALHVHAFYGGSIGTTSVQAAPPGLTIPILLSNEGNSLEPWTVTLRLPPGWTSQETLPAKVVVPAHGSTIFRVHAIAPETTAPGDRQMLVKATLPNGEKREGIVTVGVTFLRTASVVVANDQPQGTRGALSYPVTVENVGNVDAPFKVLLLGAPAGVSAKLEPASFTLPPGGRTIATLTVTPSTSTAAGAYQIAGYSLFEGVHPDTVEGKANVQTLRFTLIRPDLRAGTVEYAPHTGVRPGEHVVVKVPITNRGQGTVLDLPVHLFVDDVFVGEARLPTLGAGERRDATFNWTALPGKHTLTAVADPWNDTVDAQREDNAVSTLVEVQGTNAGSLAGAAKVPMPSASWVLLIAAAAAMVLAKRERRPPR